MKSKPNRYRRLTIYAICINLMIFDSIRLCKGLSQRTGYERTLSRRRRYLIFPEGSSLQIVYDAYHPVVDYTNLLVVGITGALAWELPSKPVHPDEELQEIYKNGSLSLLRRNDSDDVKISNVRMVNTTAKPTTYNGMDKFLHYLSYAQPAKEVKTMTNFYNDLTNGKIPSRKHSNSHHSIHPKIGRRSISENVMPTSEDLFYWEQHRASRYKLYKHLEKFIDTTGHDGRDCILKALCETGQIKRNETKRSFLGEMMRAIFSLPVQDPEENSSKELYEAAFMERRNCTTEYPKCSHKIWKSPFH